MTILPYFGFWGKDLEGLVSDTLRANLDVLFKLRWYKGFMILVREPISLSDIRQQHSRFFERMVKVVVDLEQKILALDAEMHTDLEQFLLEEGSNQAHLWGANVYFEGPIFVEYTSLINIRPAQGNRDMEVVDPHLKKQILDVIRSLITH